MPAEGARLGKLEDDMFGPCIEGPADEIMNAAWEAKTPAARRKGARKALAIDLNCLDAYTLLAIEAETLAETIALLREAVRIGDDLFAPLMGEDVQWWGFIGTRPYMRAIHNLGIAMTEAGDDPKAVYEKLLALNPDDNQGIRGLLVDIHLRDDDLDALRRLTTAYEGDMLIESVMGTLYLNMREGRPAAVLKRRAAEIEARNPFVLHHLAGAGRPEREIEFSPHGIAPGSEAEAFDYAQHCGAAWSKRRAIVNAIRKHVEEAKDE